MGFYRKCPYCGANLDPGERCDCRDPKYCDFCGIRIAEDNVFSSPPLADGYCCEKCFHMKVLPAKMERALGKCAVAR